MQLGQTSSFANEDIFIALETAALFAHMYAVLALLSCKLMSTWRALLPAKPITSPSGKAKHVLEQNHCAGTTEWHTREFWAAVH